jgi:hypothetical protein
MADAVDPWWIIGSAAVALHGGVPVSVADVDVLGSVRDARAMAARLGLAADAGGGDALFRSTVFVQLGGLPMPVEVMAGFDVMACGTWAPVWPATREWIAVGSGEVAVPSRAELRALLASFGREKDLARVKLLDDV